jgi:putative inorganic carbon (hco3(-)) transporter
VGFYSLFLMGVLMYYVDRMFGITFPIGTVYDFLAIFTFGCVFVNSRHQNDWTNFKNPITITYAIITTYQIAQFFNPNAVSHVAWMVAMRANTSMLVYVAGFQLFKTLKGITGFTSFWLTFSTIIALYGFTQEYIGMLDFEYHWIVDNPERFKLYFIWGKMRKMSMLSDPSAYGLYMAMGGLAFLALAMGPFKPVYRLLLLSGGIIHLWAMTFSGTRTAIAMVAVGIVFYIILTLRNKKTLLFMMVAGVVGLGILFGPFYGGTANRIRSTFNPSQDPSMAVRDMKRQRLQEYVLSHPIGGGVNTTGQAGLKYSQGHYLAQGFDPDSGYLLIGLELGYIGLIIFMGLFSCAMIMGINNYFSLNDPLLKTLNLAFLMPMFALSVAHFTQDAMFTKPMSFIVLAGYGVLSRIKQFDKKLFSVDLV